MTLPKCQDDRAVNSVLDLGVRTDPTAQKLPVSGRVKTLPYSDVRKPLKKPPPLSERRLVYHTA